MWRNGCTDIYLYIIDDSPVTLKSRY